MAVISYSKEVEAASRFIEYLTSKEGKKIYAEYGWIHKF
ncbi:MAG: hypothetical protein KIH08_02275 [Candidatus Freyarchaeota archaeon]|nr:hypothetical protein [Candidatus Jordarchaeia archaeon]MBS7268446.1 hypothetical protein [Candidatus Jordarchaeia archaeon]MBS7280937.1 hypothetical protein [Candidatus Jordarchaeia archaeon]